MPEREYLENLILIGSSARKAGKTTYVLKYLQESKIKMIAIKIQTSPNCSDIEILREENAGDKNDTQKYLQNGALESYLIKCPDTQIKDSFIKLYVTLDPNTYIICESTSLVKFIRPQKYILFLKDSGEENKADIDLYKSLADDVIRISCKKDYVI